MSPAAVARPDPPSTPPQTIPTPSSQFFRNSSTAAHLQHWYDHRATLQDRQQFAKALASSPHTAGAPLSRASTPSSAHDYGSALDAASRLQAFADKPTWHYTATCHSAHTVRAASARASLPSTQPPPQQQPQRPPPTPPRPLTSRPSQLRATRTCTAPRRPTRGATPGNVHQTTSAAAPARAPPATLTRTWVDDPVLSQYRLAYCTPELSPDTYQHAVALARSRPVNPGTFKSAWAESLQKGAQEMQRLSGPPTSTYSAVNASVHRSTMATQLQADSQFFDWVARQKLYYGEMLQPEVAGAVTEAVRQASPQQRLELLHTFRKMKAAVSIHEMQSTSRRDYQVVQPLLQAQR